MGTEYLFMAVGVGIAGVEENQNPACKLALVASIDRSSDETRPAQGKGEKGTVIKINAPCRGTEPKSSCGRISSFQRKRGHIGI